MKFICTVLLFIAVATATFPQKVSSPQGVQFSGKIVPTVCYAKYQNENTYVSAPASFIQGARIQTAVFEVTYVDFSPEAKAAFQAAVDIWSTLITSDVKIRITATWKSLGAGVLGSASAGTFMRDFQGAQRAQTWYPVALAEKITGKELNGTDPDIVASFNSTNSSWFYGTSGQTPSGKFDLVSIVLHEIGHGLGINHNYTVDGDNGEVLNNDLVFNYVTYIENGSNVKLVPSYPQPSPELKTQLTSGNLFFNSESVLAANSNSRAKIYAPSTFSPGSSIAHLDENTYKAGDINSLMTPQIGFAEVVHNPGPIVMAMLNDMGWKRTLIEHTPISNTENINSPFNVTCIIKSDDGYDASSVKLHYSTDGNTFAILPMTATGVANEFSASLPGTGNAIKYKYYLSANDNKQREFVSPGKIFVQGEPVRQATYQFEAGPDTKAPKIVHSAKQFFLNTDTKLDLEAVISDNIGIQNVKVEYQINGVAKTDVAMTLADPKEDSVYKASIPFSPLLSINDIIKYRIVATDNSIAHNQAIAPSATSYFEIPVVGLLPVQNSYSNNFNSATTDFFGDDIFSIQKPTGFTDGAIHTSHPYPNGSGPNNESNFVYQLKVPVKVKAVDAFVKFDEIVLVEPSDANAAFGSDGFFDYVIVEGSKDKGATWKKLIDGYNSRSQTDWLNKFNSSVDKEAQANSTAVGDPSLFKTRQIDLLAAGNFAAGDEVAIRFRLFADQLVHGWGWAIDNLRIQIDDVPPVVLHDHLDYQLKENSVFKIVTKATDSNGLAQLNVDFRINDQPIQTSNLNPVAGTDQYTLNQTVTGLNTGDVFKYKIRAKDLAGNETVLPPNGFFNVTVIELGQPITQYVSDFNSPNSDFIGNFFSIAKPDGFSNPLIQTTHPYPTGFGLNKTSSFNYMLKSPITISETNPFISFDEVAIVQPGASVSADYVVVEASKDKGTTWESVVNPYDASANNTWNSAFAAATNGNSSMLKNRAINLTSTGKFKAGDNVLIRFRLFSNAATNAWGWAIDNLSIQGPITGLESSVVQDVSTSIYPNPVENGKLTVELNSPASSLFHLSFFDSRGVLLTQDEIQTSEEVRKKEYDIKWSSGLYILRIQSGDKSVTQKFVVK
jgi:hypothetical protein